MTKAAGKTKAAKPGSKYRHRHPPPLSLGPDAPPPAAANSLYFVVVQVKGDDQVYSGIYDNYALSERELAAFYARYGIGKEHHDSKIFGKMVSVVLDVCTLNKPIS